MTSFSDEEFDERMRCVDREKRFALWNVAAILHAAHGETPEQAVEEAIELTSAVDERLVADHTITRELQEFKEYNG